MLPKETFDAIVDLAAKGGAAIVPAANEPNGAYYVRNNGKLELCLPAPAFRKHKAESLETLGTIATTQRESDFEFQVWYSHRMISIRFGDSWRDQATLAYGESDQLKMIRSWEKSGHKYKHAEFVLMIRTLFADCQRRCPDLLPSVRNVKFKTLQESASNVQSKNVSLGKKLESEVSGTTALPEEIVFEVPVFDSVFDVQAEIRCVLNIDSQAETFQLIPLPGDTAAAVDVAKLHIETAIADVFAKDDFDNGRILHGEF